MKSKLFSAVISSCGLTHLSRYLNKEKVVVLMYHGVTNDDSIYTSNNGLQVLGSAFEEQMIFLKKYYDIVPLSKATECSYAKPRLAITFDDGYANNYNVAFPILEKHGIPATIFLVTDTIDRDHVFWFDKLFALYNGEIDNGSMDGFIDGFKNIHSIEIDEAIDTFLSRSGKVLNKDIIDLYRTLRFAEIKEMASSGLVEFGSHTHRHELLTLLEDHEAYETLKSSYDIMKEIPANNDYICYPNGWYHPKHINMCKKIGFVGGISTKKGFWGDSVISHEIPRFSVSRDLNLHDFSNKISGLLGSLSTIKKIMKKYF